jgi:hypothetical protein
MLKVDAIVLFNGKAYFFEGSQYVRYDQETFQQDPGYPRPIAGNWPDLWESDIDAATNWGASGKAFFFKGSEYIGYDLQSDTADDAKPIEGNWSGVWDSDIDAALDWGNGKLYVFKGSEYVRYDIAADKADDGYPQPIEGNWDRLWSDGIDAAVNWGNGKAYFFRGDEYLSYDIAAESVDSGYPRKIASGWPPSTSTATATPGQLGAGRQNMLDLINKWMPTSLNSPMIPDGETQDLLAKAGWTKAIGQANKKVKDDGGKFATSCGDVLKALLTLWKSNFVGAFNIRDSNATGRGPGAKQLGYYVEADGVQSPQPGDIIVLRNGVGKASAGIVGHVGILVEAGETEWRTADGGGGALPDQTASVTTRTVRFENNISILRSPTDLKEKQLDGWVDLGKLEQTGG